jgi:hypothetical protein
VRGDLTQDNNDEIAMSVGEKGRLARERRWGIG